MLPDLVEAHYSLSSFSQLLFLFLFHPHISISFSAPGTNFLPLSFSSASLYFCYHISLVLALCQPLLCLPACLFLVQKHLYSAHSSQSKAAGTGKNPHRFCPRSELAKWRKQMQSGESILLKSHSLVYVYRKNKENYSHLESVMFCLLILLCSGLDFKTDLLLYHVFPI